MATTNNYRVGRVRQKLAELLKEAVPGLEIYPQNLHSQTPVYASPKWDCCSWYASGKVNGIQASFSGWDTMSACIKNGIELSPDKNLCYSWEVSQKSKKKNAELSENITLNLRPQIPSGMDNEIQEESSYW